MSNVPRSNAELESALNNVTDASQLRETLLSTLAAQGQIVRSRDDAFNNHLVMRPQTPEASLSASTFRFEKEIRWAESTGKRAVIIRSNSQAALDELEKQITR